MEYKNGLKEIEQNNGDKYTADALNEAIQEYKASKSKAINKELGAFDDQSKSLLDKAHKQIEQLNVELSTGIDPNSQYELDKHNYILNKLQNELSSTFTSKRPSIDELDEVLNQAKYGSVAKLKLYAHLYKTIKANIVLTVKSFVSINYFSFFSINIT